MKRLLTLAALVFALLAPMAATAHPSYVSNTGWGCAGQGGTTVPINSTTWYVCYGNTWWISHINH